MQCNRPEAVYPTFKMFSSLSFIYYFFSFHEIHSCFFFTRSSLCITSIINYMLRVWYFFIANDIIVESLEKTRFRWEGSKKKRRKMSNLLVTLVYLLFGRCIRVLTNAILLYLFGLFLCLFLLRISFFLTHSFSADVIHYFSMELA